LSSNFFLKKSLFYIDFFLKQKQKKKKIPFQNLNRELLPLNAIFTKGENLFSIEIKGIRVLFPDFIFALKRILDVPLVQFLLG